MLDSAIDKHEDFSTHHEPSILDQYIPGKIEPKPARLPVKVNRLGQPVEVSMKNGRYRVALVAGGIQNTAANIREALAERRGLHVKYHLEEMTHTGWNNPLPKDVDLVIMLKDVIGHEQMFKVREACRVAGVRMVATSKNVAAIVGAMANHGIRSAEIPSTFTTKHMKWGVDLESTVKPVKVEEPPKYIRETPVVAVPVVGVAVAQAPLKPVPEMAPVINLVVQQAVAPVEAPAKIIGRPSQQLALLASYLYSMCVDEQVSILCTPRELTFNPATAA